MQLEEQIGVDLREVGIDEGARHEPDVGTLEQGQQLRTARVPFGDHAQQAERVLGLRECGFEERVVGLSSHDDGISEGERGTKIIDVGREI